MQLSEMTVDLNSASLQPDSSASPEQQQQKVRRKERKKAATLTEDQLRSRSSGGVKQRSLENKSLGLDLITSRWMITL